MISVADLVMLVHLFIIVFIILGTFSTDQEIVLLSLMFQISVLVHWILNDTTCVLTQIEKYMRGEPDDGRTFFGQVFEGVYTSGKEKPLSQVILFVLIMISLYRIKSFGALFGRYGLRRVRD